MRLYKATAEFVCAKPKTSKTKADVLAKGRVFITFPAATLEEALEAGKHLLQEEGLNWPCEVTDIEQTSDYSGEFDWIRKENQ